MQIFICGWWVCPELYLRRPFNSHASSRLDALLESKAKQGVQVCLSGTTACSIVPLMNFPLTRYNHPLEHSSLSVTPPLHLLLLPQTPSIYSDDRLPE